MSTDIIVNIPISNSVMTILQEVRAHSRVIEFDIDDFDGVLCLFGTITDAPPCCEDCPCWDGFETARDIDEELYRRGVE